MSDPPIVAETAIELIVRLVVAAAERDLVLLVGSRAYGMPRDDSDYDILLVLRNAADVEHVRRAATNVIRAAGVSVDVLACTVVEYQRHQFDPGFIDYIAASHGVVLYATGAVAQRSAPRVHEQDWSEGVVLWTRRAESDLRAAESMVAAAEPAAAGAVSRFAGTHASGGTGGNRRGKADIPVAVVSFVAYYNVESPLRVCHGSSQAPLNYEAKRIMRPRDLVLSAALAVIAWTPSLSQSNPQSTPRFGIIAGVNLATLTRDFFQNATNRTGFAAGFMAVLPVSPSFAIQPEFMFTMKGANSKPGGPDGTARIDNIELPVLARVEIPAFRHVKPFVYGGPGFAYRTSCTLEGRDAQGAIKVSCDSLARQAARAEPGATYSRTDVDGIIGGGFVFDVGGRTMTVSARYDVGFVKVLSYLDGKNRVLSFMGTLEWPFHK